MLLITQQLKTQNSKLNTMLEKPFADACERNRQPIFEIISPLLANTKAVLEIGSGTGQHAVFFAQQLPNLTWHTSDRNEYHPGIRLWIKESKLSNVTPPVTFDVSVDDNPALPVDAVFSANTAHIMHWNDVENMFEKVGELLPIGGVFLLYGPFKIEDQYSSNNDALFDQHLRHRDPKSGIRDIEKLDYLAKQASMFRQHLYPMPSNNYLACWQRQA